MRVACNCVVGVIEQARFVGECLTVQPGDLLYFYTDGVTEAISETDSFYGEERLDRLLLSLPAESTAKHVNDTIAAEVDTFAGKHDQADDITMLSLRYRP